MLGVTILAIITAPLLHTFVTGARIEYKSRLYGETTEAAQNLSEQIQAQDAGLILSNSEAVVAGARFYNYGGASYTLYGTEAPELSVLPRTYYIGIPNYSFGNSKFDALIELQLPDETANSEPVVVGNQMDASLDMTEADSTAVDALLAECGDLTPGLSIRDLTRNINVNITKTVDSTADTYRIDALFTYTATIPYTIEESPDIHYYSFSYTEQSSASVGSIVETTDKSPVFSVFLFYDTMYRTDVSGETLIINNPTAYPDINFFIVNTNTTTSVPAGYRAILWYKYQDFDGDYPVNNLVFTNIPYTNVEYRAAKDALYKKTVDVTGYLVETQQLDRKFNVRVKLFSHDSDNSTRFTGTPLVDIDSTKLNY